MTVTHRGGCPRQRLRRHDELQSQFYVSVPRESWESSAEYAKREAAHRKHGECEEVPCPTCEGLCGQGQLATRLATLTASARQSRRPTAAVCGRRPGGCPRGAATTAGSDRPGTTVLGRPSTPAWRNAGIGTEAVQRDQTTSLSAPRRGGEASCQRWCGAECFKAICVGCA